jgi:hypothetical protein
MSTASKPPAEEVKEELSIPEIFAKHKDKWVAMVVTKRDDNLQPVGGKVVAEDVDRYRLREHLSGYADICIFYAGVSLYPLLL